MRNLFLLIPVIVALTVPLYNVSESHLFGVPYFWWFQLAGIPVSALFILAVYLGDRS